MTSIFDDEQPVTLWGDLHPPQSQIPAQEPTTEKHIKVSLTELNETRNLTQHKKCPVCYQKKPLIAFYKSSKNIFGRSSICKECDIERCKKRAPTRIERDRYRTLKKFNLTPNEYDAMLQAQNGVCASCGNQETRIDPRSKVLCNLAVDHDHITGKVRALLCTNCNKAYGNLREDPQRIKALLAYHYKVHGEDINE